MTPFGVCVFNPSPAGADEKPPPPPLLLLVSGNAGTFRLPNGFRGVIYNLAGWEADAAAGALHLRPAKALGGQPSKAWGHALDSDGNPAYSGTTLKVAAFNPDVYFGGSASPTPQQLHRVYRVAGISDDDHLRRCARARVVLLFSRARSPPRPHAFLPCHIGGISRTRRVD